MDSAALHAVQQPLKDAYREKPQDAVVTLRAMATSLAHPAEMTVSAPARGGGL